MLRWRSDAASAISPEFFRDVQADRERVNRGRGGGLDFGTAPRLAATVAELLDVGFGRIVVDLRPLTFLDSCHGRRIVASVMSEQPDRDTVDPHHVAVAGLVEPVVGLGLWRRLRHPDPLVAVVHPEAHGQPSQAGVSAQLADADKELRDAVIHGRRYPPPTPKSGPIGSARLASSDGRPALDAQ
jgi:hypothetical protein